MWLSLRLELDLIIRMSRRTWTTHLPIFLISSVKVSNIPPGKTCAHTYPNLKRACMNCFSNCYHFDIWYLHRSGSFAPILIALRKLAKAALMDWNAFCPDWQGALLSFAHIALQELHSYTYKELSSPIFQSQSGIGNTCPDLHFMQYIKA